MEVENLIWQIVINQVDITTSQGEKHFWESYIASFSFDEEKKMTISIAQDITNIIKAKANLTETKDRLELLLGSTSSGS
ncbi:MAG: hypothetical protein ACFCAD_16105 [Pleurocapsa sp.]